MEAQAGIDQSDPPTRLNYIPPGHAALRYCTFPTAGGASLHLNCPFDHERAPSVSVVRSPPRATPSPPRGCKQPERQSRPSRCVVTYGIDLPLSRPSDRSAVLRRSTDPVDSLAGHSQHDPLGRTGESLHALGGQSGPRRRKSYLVAPIQPRK